MKICVFCEQRLPDEAVACSRCGRSQTFNEDDRPAFGWGGCAVLIVGTAAAITALALGLGFYFGWLPGFLNTDWGFYTAVLLILAFIAHRTKKVMEAAEDSEKQAIPKSDNPTPES